VPRKISGPEKGSGYYVTRKCMILSVEIMKETLMNGTCVLEWER
jgi:hypothetical protein